MRIIRASGVLLPALFAVLSCSDPVAVLTPASIMVVSGGNQTAVVTSALSPIVVEVKDADDRAVRGADVSWVVTSGGGTVSAASTRTDRSGRAEVLWTLGTEAGTSRLSAAVTGVAPLSITAVAEPGAPASMTILSGDNQTAVTSTQLNRLLALVVRDAHGNGIRGAAVTFMPSSGTVEPLSPTTDGGGVARAQWTLGEPAGEQTTDASVAGLDGHSVRFTARALSVDDITAVTNDEPIGDIGSAEGLGRYYRINVPANTVSLTITTVGGSGDVDMYVRYGMLPATFGANACESESPTATETCELENPVAGDWFVLLYAFTTYSGVTLNASQIIGGALVISTTGLPQGAAPAIRVSGPGYEQSVNTTSFTASLRPGTYSLSAGLILNGETVYAAAPEEQDVEIVSGAESSVTVAYAATTGELNLDIQGAYITQAVQRRDGSIPLIAGRDGLLRVFARGNAVSSERPEVRARIYHNGSLVDTRTIAAPAEVVPISHDEGVLTTTWNVVLPGSLIQPGMALLVDVDPANALAEPDETDNVFPASATPVELDVWSAPRLAATLIPVRQTVNGLQGDVTSENQDTYISTAQALYPLPGIDVEVRAPYEFSAALASSYDSTWQRLLRELNALRMTEAPDRYYYGVVQPAYQNGGTGLGYIGQRAAIGVDWLNWRAETVAHEWGHNFGRLHVNCGNPANPDMNYPYDKGRLGHHGYDIRTNEMRSLDTHYDLMSYCAPTWSSDYTYEAVMTHRATQAGASGSAVAQPSLLVWGSISPEGVVLEPSFEVVARPSLPGKSGRYRLSGTSDAGATVLDISFDGYEIDHMPGVRTFAYVIPLSALGGEAPSRLRLRGAGVDETRTRTAVAAGADDLRVERVGADRVRLRWNAARNPVIMVRDERTGAILSFARAGDALVTTTAAQVEVNLSDGVRSITRRIPVTR
jgi:hypothetical protein